MSNLDWLTTVPAFTRIYYGRDKNFKPNEHCHWDDGQFSQYFGWFENDEHLRNRIKEVIDEQ